MTYTQKIQRDLPGCFIFLLDQSYSMAEPVRVRPVSKAQMLADIVNDMIMTIVQRCYRERHAPPRHYYDVAVIGYGDKQAEPLFAGPHAGHWLVPSDQLEEAIIGHEERGGSHLPVWFQPYASGGTPMCAALNAAGYHADGWAAAHPDSFPPIIFNITDGQANDGSIDEVLEWSRRLKSIQTNDGELLLFTIGLSATETEARFPVSPAKLTDPWTQAMFEMSSPLPSVMAEFARDALGEDVRDGARAMVANARPEGVLLALRTGTDALQLR